MAPNLRQLIAAISTLSCLSLVMPAASAALLSFEFRGTAAAGSSLDLGVGAVDLAGVSFVIEGRTTSDADLFPSAIGAAFDSLSVFDFGSEGSFVSDETTGEFYSQGDCFPGDAVSELNCVGIGGPVDGAGLLAGFSPGLMVDFNLGGTPIGIGLVPDYSLDGRAPFRLTNQAGHILILLIDDDAVSSTSAVPAPATLMLAVLGLIAVRATRQHRRA